ncbi:unnamed protein product [Durusdinium trenchii]|uniref:Uncharacterized protein n=1 Tax=Durusdinium trenchii TaxID=1381693 RepID=A0ABP0JQ17_9DINO
MPTWHNGRTPLLIRFWTCVSACICAFQASTAFAGLLAQRCSRTALQAQEDSSPAVGLDVGTTNSAVAVRRADGRFLVVPPPGAPRGRPTMPSVVAFNSEGDSVVGLKALRVKHISQKQVVFHSMKRLLGRTYEEAHQIGLRPSELGADPSGQAREIVRLLLPGGRVISVEEVVAVLIKELVKIAENYLGQPIKRAILGVPVRWNKYQKRALEYAAELAGLETVRLVPEPELAVRAYGVRTSPNADIVTGGGNLGPRPRNFKGKVEIEATAQRLEENPYSASAEELDTFRESMKKIQNPTAKHILVADLGGGTFDVCIVRQWVEWDEIHIQFTSGDERLGGNDFDNALTTWCLKQMKPEMQRLKKWPLSRESQDELRILAKKAKERLSSSDSAEILFGPFKATVTRDNFRVICLDVLKRLLVPIREAAYGSHLRLPFESLAEEALDVAERSTKRKKRRMTERDLRTRSKQLRSKHQKGDVEDDDEIMIDEILLIGAATWNPAVREILALVTGVTPSSASIDPETSVALGAAILASIMDQQMTDMQVHSPWRSAWVEYLMKKPSLLKKFEEEQQSKMGAG